MQKTTKVTLTIFICLLLAGCVTSVDESLPYAQLPETTLATEVSLVASPSHPTAYLSSDPIPAGELVHVIGTDEDAAWLLVLHDDMLGWMPTIFSRTNIATFKPAIVLEPLSSTCTEYLGSTVGPDEEWTSNTSGSAIVLGSIYRPQAENHFEDASLMIEIDGDGSAVAADYIHAPLTDSSAIVLFAFLIRDLKNGSQIRFSLSNPNDEPLLFQATFFRNDCPDDFVERLPIGKRKLWITEEVSPPQGDVSSVPMVVVLSQSGTISITTPTSPVLTHTSTPTLAVPTSAIRMATPMSSVLAKPRGRIEATFPFQMNIDEAAIVTVEIIIDSRFSEVGKHPEFVTGKISIQAESQSGDRSRLEEEIMLYPVMSAELIASNFEVSNTSFSPRRRIGPATSAVWMWDITAKKAGKQAITINLYGSDIVEDETDDELIKVLSRNIDVYGVSVYRKLFSYLSKNWIAIVGTNGPLALIIAYLTFRFNQKSKQEKGAVSSKNEVVDVPNDIGDE